MFRVHTGVKGQTGYSVRHFDSKPEAVAAARRWARASQKHWAGAYDSRFGFSVARFGL